MKKIMYWLLSCLALAACSQARVIPPSETPALPTPTDLPTKTPTLLPTETLIPRKGVLVSNTGSDFGNQVPPSWLAADPAQARYEIILTTQVQVLNTCRYGDLGDHYLDLQGENVTARIMDLETNQWAAEQVFTNLEYADTTCPANYDFNLGENSATQTIARADNDADEAQIFKNWLTETMHALEASALVPRQTQKIGQVVSIGDYGLIVLGWENIQSDGFSKPGAGNKLIVVEFILVNQSQSDSTIFATMSLQDGTGRRYEEDFWNTPNDGRLPAALKPGEKVRGKMAFEIPENAQSLQFVFDNRASESGIVFIDLGKEPGLVEPPAVVPGAK